jgi:23S rRNA (uridine2552-2'-O)-methyltransferase
MREHVNDRYVKQAQRDGYRSRSAYKLLEIDAKDKLFAAGMVVVDLGAAPGGWSQVAAAKVGSQGLVIGVDLLPVSAIPGANFIHGDFTLDNVQHAILRGLGHARADLVLSDLAPNISGIAAADQARHYALAEAALAFSGRLLKLSGALLVKVFQGADFNDFHSRMRNVFEEVHVRKPSSSRDRSAEVYLLGKRVVKR